ncbi:hypothetical protein [Kitasatospora brasiliensis]|uniref:hypothetical protein n=1 Tax=Kitasatospora brasiliensis TaxID=3058040 RepID=UPI00292F57D8|nr:hypothetical protein [Kitasatospora sp. K002]
MEEIVTLAHNVAGVLRAWGERKRQADAHPDDPLEAVLLDLYEALERTFADRPMGLEVVNELVNGQGELTETDCTIFEALLRRALRGDPLQIVRLQRIVARLPPSYGQTATVHNESAVGSGGVRITPSSARRPPIELRTGRGEPAVGGPPGPPFEDDEEDD